MPTSTQWSLSCSSEGTLPPISGTRVNQRYSGPSGAHCPFVLIQNDTGRVPYVGAGSDDREMIVP